MKKLFFGFLLLFAVFVTNAQTSDTSQNTMEKSVLRHVVLFGYKADADSAGIQKVVDAFKALPGKISEIKQFEYGINNSPENLNQGLTHCFLLTFESEEDRNAYLVHPDHKAFGDVLKPYLDKVTVLDYWSQK
jgi:hypothetical protein